jgi:8-oxo-dGTP diphosphatase
VRPPGFIEVVAAVVIRADGVLLCQRPNGPHLPLLWEFPGGKIDPGESPRQALERELREELDVASSIGSRVATVEHHYTEKSVRIQFFAADIAGTPRPMVHRELRWIAAADLGDYEVPPANRSVVSMVRDCAVR